MNSFMKITKALADPNRVRALIALDGRELCLCQIVKILNLATSTVSRHMAILRDAGLVKGRKTEKWVYYSLPGADAPILVSDTISWVLESLSKSEQVKEDKKRLKEILKIDIHELCKVQGK